MKKLLATAAAVSVLLAIAIGIGSLGWKPGRRAGPPRIERAAAGAGDLVAGAAAVPLDPPAGGPIAGFARLRWTSSGVRDPVFARAIVLTQPGISVALVSVEILLVPSALARAVEERVRDLKLDHVLLAATHTHAGPGGYWDDRIAQPVALGPYDPVFAEQLVQRIADAIRRAADARQPATIAIGQTEADRLARNRGDGAVDGRLVRMRLAARGAGPLADIVIFPSHPTILGQANDRISGDWPGALARFRPFPVLVFQGALGDQSSRPPRGRDAGEKMEKYAKRVRGAAEAVHLRLEEAPTIAVATATAVLPPPDLGATPPFLKRLTKNVLYGWFPDRTRVSALRIGPLTLLAVPAEPVEEVGRRWREAAGSGAEILALSNDYLGYVETGERMAHGEGETERTYYGPELADRLGEAVKLAASEVEKAVGALAQNRTAGAPESVQVR